MIPVLRKVAQLNIKYRKKWEPHNRCLHRAPPDEVTVLSASNLHHAEVSTLRCQKAIKCQETEI